MSNMTIQHKRVGPSLLIMLCMFGGLFTSACDKTSPKSSKREAAKASAAKTTPADESKTSTQAQTLVIGQQIIAELHHEVTEAGLTTAQADIITQSAQTQMVSQIGTLAVPEATYALAESGSQAAEPIALVMPGIIMGAMMALDDTAALLPDSAQRSMIAGVIVDSTFTSLNGRTAKLSSATLLGLGRGMVGTAVSSMADAGLRNEAASLGAQAITSGAIGALKKAGLNEETRISVAKSVVAGAIEHLSEVDFGSTTAMQGYLSSAVGNAAGGAISQIGEMDLAEPTSVGLAGELSGFALETLTQLNKRLPAGSLSLEGAVKEVSQHAVSALKSAGMNGTQMGPALQSITSSMVGALEGAGFDRSNLAKGAGAIAAGSMAGVAGAGISEQDVIAKGLVRDVMTGTLKNLSSSKLSSIERAEAFSNIVGGALGAMAEAGIKTPEHKDSTINSVLQESVANFKAAGIEGSSLVALAAEGMARGATMALPASGISSTKMSLATGMITKSSINSILEARLNSSASELKDMTGKVTKGVMEGVGHLQEAGTISAALVQSSASEVVSQAMGAVILAKQTASISLSTRDLGDISSQLAEDALSGLAMGGVAQAALATIKTDMSSQVVNDLRSQGVVESQLTEVAQNLDSAAAKAVSLATNLQSPDGGFMACAVHYRDELDDASFFALIPAAKEGPVYCRTAQQAVCPKARANTDYRAEWLASAATISQNLSTPFLCELKRQELAVALPGAFAITSAGGTVTVAEPLITWQASAGASYYVVKIGSDGECHGAGTIQQTSATSLTVESLGEGSHFVCVNAFNSLDHHTAASNSGLSLLVDTAPPTWSGAGILINNGTTDTASSSVTLAFAVTDASEMYVTNTAGCASDGGWEAYATSKPWSLGQGNTTATVYARFRDTAGNMSTCTSDSIVHNDLPPSATSITIAGGDSFATSAAVSLTLAAVNASAMYVTNTPGCAANGSWEAYTTTKNWTLAQTNTTATVYVAYKNALGTVSACEADTITHDSQEPTATSIMINTNAAATSNAAVSLALTATDAADMYISNVGGCTSGGSWETYSAMKAWNLGQSNGLATVYIKYRDVAGNESPCINDTITHDDQAPSATSISIENGATVIGSASVTISLSATDVSEMYVTNTAGCGSGGSWEAYATSKAWTLGQTNATATVYVKFRDSVGNASNCISDTIVHDPLVPTGTTISINTNASHTNSTTVSLTLGATNASDMYVTDASDCSSGGSWEAYATSRSWTLSQTETTATVYIKYKTAGGAESSCISDTIIHDSISPASTSISIAAGATYATTTSVTLTLAATGASEMYVTNTAACGSGGSWEAYTTSKAWTLGQTNGTATVYIKYRDAAANETSCISDTITHDSSAPTSTSISIAAGATYATSTSVTLTLAATGASEMYITNTAACASGGSWETYATSKAWTLGQLNTTATVYAKFRDAAGNESPCTSDPIVHDDTLPVGTITISLGAQYTTSSSVTLGLNSPSPDVTHMFITNTAGCASGGSWVDYGSTWPSWTLTQTNTQATVYVKFKDAAGNIGPCFSDFIVHDGQNPSTPTGIMIISSQLSWSPSTDNGSGITGYKLSVGVSAGDSSIMPEGSLLPTTTYSLANLSLVAGNSYSIGLRAFDAAGNSSSITNQTFTYTVQWRQQAFVKALNNQDADDFFGTSVALDADTLAVGAINEDSLQTTITNATTASTDNSMPDAGAVYVYKRSGTTWVQESYIKASNARDGNNFGIAVSLSGDTLAVGAWTEDSSQSTITNGASAAINTDTTNSGAVYVYKRNATTWAQQAYIKGINNHLGDQFGESISLMNDTLAVGSSRDDNSQQTITNGTSIGTFNAVGDSGAVYVYKRNGTSWTHESFIKASNGMVSDTFGEHVALYNDTLVVGAPAEDSERATIYNGSIAPALATVTSYAGAAYVYQRSATSWQQQAYIKAANNRQGSKFGTSVALYGNTIAVGAPEEMSNQTVITNGTTASADTSAATAGAAYVYQRTGTTWAQQAYIKAANALLNNRFGEQLSLSSDYLAVAAKQENSSQTTITNGTIAWTNSGLNESGAVYIYKRNGTIWSQQAYVKAINADANDHFGYALVMSTSTLVVGALHEDSNQTGITNGTTASTNNSLSNSGAVYIYTR